MEIKKRISASVEEIFSTMVMMSIVPSAQGMDLKPLKKSITAVIGFSGEKRGLLAVHMPLKVAFAVTSSFLMMDVDELNEDVEDAIGELANMIGGEVKNILSSGGKDIDLSVPSTISGETYDFQAGRGNDRYIVNFEVAAGVFSIDCQIEK